MTLQQRISLLTQLGEYMRANESGWLQAKQRAASLNPWFIPEFIEQAAEAIYTSFLQEDALRKWAADYHTAEVTPQPKLVGVVMAGNIPMVGFHDLLSVFVSGHRQLVKLSSKDEVLIKHLVDKMAEWDGETNGLIGFADKIAGCDAYIATGGNNTGRYFNYYFGKYPNIIRRNRTSVAVLSGSETPAELEKLADDIQTYFGLGCRNITKLYVPNDYNFEPLLHALNKYAHFADYHKYRHNYDYQLALLMMGNKMYMTNGTVLLNENASLFTAISQVHYEFYTDKESLVQNLQQNSDVQCIVGAGLPFGNAQAPSLTDYADGVDTMKFLAELS